VGTGKASLGGELTVVGVLAVLKQMPRHVLVRETGLARSSITAIRNQHVHLHVATRRKLTQAAGAFARQQLLQLGIRPPAELVAACARFMQEMSQCYVARDEGLIMAKLTPKAN
jgi:hypothetical protein